MVTTALRSNQAIQSAAGGMIKLKVKNVTNEDSREVILGQKDPNQTEWSIGRADNADLFLGDQTISTNHAKIKLIDGNFYFSDVGSKGGSILNFNKVGANQLQMLEEGDYIYISMMSLSVQEIIPTFPASHKGSGQQTVLQQQSWSNEDITVRCFRIIEETPNAKTFLLAGNPQTIFYYLPGQFIMVELEIDGKLVRRPYSISSSPSNPYSLGITVKRVPAQTDDETLPAGMVSNWLHDHFKEGDSLKIIGGPMGQFTYLPDLPPKLLLIGAGSGITPLMSMMRWFYETTTETDIVLLHSAKDVPNILFRDDIDRISKHIGNVPDKSQQFKAVTTLSRPQPGQAWDGFVGRVTPELIKLAIPDFSERHIFCCGPHDFMESIKEMMKGLEFPMQNYQEESFGDKGKNSPKPAESTPQQDSSIDLKEVAPPVANPAKAIDSNQNGNGKNGAAGISPTTEPSPIAAPVITNIQFTQSQVTADIDPDESLLEIAQAAGVSIRNACRAGICGACKVRIKGTVTYDRPPEALSQEEQNKGYALACVAYVKTGLIVEA